MTIQVLYSCALCRLKRVPVDVPAREAEALTPWLDRTIALVAHDHIRRSPGCQAQELSDLFIPHPHDAVTPIGGATVQ